MLMPRLWSAEYVVGDRRYFRSGIKAYSEAQAIGYIRKISGFKAVGIVVWEE